MFTVYAVREKNTRGVYKIGHTANLKQRIYNLSSGNWRGIELAMLMGRYNTKTEAMTAETYIHRRLSESRIKGEWFETTLAQLREIRAEMNG